MLVDMPANDRFIRTDGVVSYLTTTDRVQLVRGAKKVEAFLDFSYHDLSAFQAPPLDYKHLWGADTAEVTLWQFSIESDFRVSFRVYRYANADDTGATIICAVKAPAANALELNTRYRIWGYDDGEGNLKLAINGAVVNTATYAALGRMRIAEDSLELGRGYGSTYFVNIGFWEAWVAYDDTLRCHFRPRYRAYDVAPNAHDISVGLPVGGDINDISGYRTATSIVGTQGLDDVSVANSNWWAGSSWSPGSV